MRLQTSGIFQKAATDGYSESGTQLDASVQTASFNSAGFYVADALTYTVVVSCPSTGTPVGTVKLQGCVDRSQDKPEKPDAGLATWFDLAFLDPTTGLYVTSKDVSSATVLDFHEQACGYRWIRLVYTRTSGTGTFTAKCQKKGVTS